MTTFYTNIGRTKPPLLRAIFILNALKIVLAFGLLVGFRFYDLQVGSLSGPSAVAMMFWTLLGYLATFTGIVVSILNRSMIGLRAAILIDFLISIPARAFVGLLIAAIGLGLTFTRSVKAYFAWIGD